MSLFGRCHGVFIILIMLKFSLTYADDEKLELLIPSTNDTGCFKLSDPLKEQTLVCFFMKRDFLMPKATEPLISINSQNWTSSIYGGRDFLMVQMNNWTSKARLPTQYDHFWVKVCSFYANNTIERLVVNYNERELIERKHVNETFSMLSSNDTSWNNETSDDVICYSSTMTNRSSSSYTLAGVILETKNIHEMNDRYNSIIENEKNLTCIGTMDVSMVHPTFMNLSSNESFVKEYELCEDTYIIQFHNFTGSYEEQENVCKAARGRFVTASERQLFMEPYVENDTIPHSSCNLTEKFLQNYDQPIFLLRPQHADKKLGCSYTFWNRDGVNNIRCVIKFACFICIVPRLQSLRLYGNLKLDTKDLIIMNHVHITDKYGLAVNINYETGSNWTFNQISSYDKWTFDSFTFPLGRKKWSKTASSKEITITSCNGTEFPCSNGLCISLQNRCNGIVECLDESDEYQCSPLKKHRGYVITQPPHLGNQSYEVHVNSLKPIEVSEGIATLDMTVWLRWIDPRITFSNLQTNTILNCSQIWTPEISVFDRCIGGFEVQPESMSMTCSPYAPKMNLSSYSTKNTYIDRITEGKEQILTKEMRFTFEVPCHFYLFQYPFGSPTCRMCLEPSTTELKLVAHKNSSKTTFDAETDLGELYLTGITDVISEDKLIVTIYFRMIYTYHLINTFIPGILICVICYISLFFPSDGFSERISVSLTAVLVLAALFSQIAETSVKTSYVKLLDLWYVSLIFYTFAIVIFHTYFHKVIVVKLENDDTGSYYSKKLEVVVETSKLVFAVLFALICCFFVGAAL